MQCNSKPYRYQMNIQSFFLMVPCIAGFFWLIAYLLFARKGIASRKISYFLAFFSFFLLFVLLTIDENRRMYLQLTLFKQVSSLMLIPAFLAYANSLLGRKSTGPVYMILYLLPILHFVVGVVSVYSAGYYDALKILIDSFTFQGPMVPYLDGNDQVLFYVTYTYVYRSFLLFDFLIFSINMMSCAISGVCNINGVLSFFFAGAKAPLRPIQFFLALLLFLIMVPALILGKYSYLNRIPLVIIGSLLIAVIISFIAFVGAAATRGRRSITDILTTVRFGGIPDEDYVTQEDDTAETVSQDSSDQIQPVPVPVVHAANEEDLNRLRQEIEKKLEDTVVSKELFLKRDLTQTAVSDALGVFKEDLSDYLDYKYGLSFQNYINMLRIKYAEQYILTHDDITQKEIALACGFSGASSFNSAFSKQNGVTPKIWKDRHIESERKA